jgi:SpoVK/Ycf46/Vps4 family AAA+-type ATPase
MHMVFAGPPGTGKTSVARLVGEICYTLGLLSKGQTVEVDRSKLVGKYQGHSAAGTAEAITKALGGVLFVDEAYSLNHGDRDDFGREVTETLLKGMDDHRDNLLVIIAGYADKMKEFIDSNPGFHSRFPNTITFSNYSPPELLAIFEKFCKDGGMTISELAKTMILKVLEQAEIDDGPRFGNGRSVRNYFERCLLRQSTRLATLASPDEQELMALEASDVLEGGKPLDLGARRLHGETTVGPPCPSSEEQG